MLSDGGVVVSDEELEAAVGGGVSVVADVVDVRVVEGVEAVVAAVGGVSVLLDGGAEVKVDCELAAVDSDDDVELLVGAEGVDAVVVVVGGVSVLLDVDGVKVDSVAAGDPPAGVD